MLKRIKLSGCLLLILMMAFPAFADAESASSQYEGFHVKGRYLYDYNGNKVTLIGVNAMVIYWDDAGARSFPNIARTSANVTRIFWNVDDNISLSKFDDTLQNCVNSKMIPVPGLWNATGKWDQLDTCVNWWLQDDVIKIVKKYEKYIIINIANEAGASVPKDEWENKYKEIITRFRNAGIRVPLMIDAANWGRDENYILEKGPALVKHDPEHNLIFSWHPWDENQPRTRYSSAFDAAVKEDLCMIVGEFSHVGVNYDKPIDWKGLVEESLSHDIGWLPWSWRGAQESDGHNMSKGYSFDNLTQWGSDIVPYIKENAVRASIFPKSQPPTPPGNLRAVGSSSIGSVLEWDPSSDDVQGITYEIYRDGVKTGTAKETSYTDIGLDSGVEYSYYVKAIDVEGNISEPSKILKITTQVMKIPDKTEMQNTIGEQKDQAEQKDKTTRSGNNILPWMLAAAGVLVGFTAVILARRLPNKRNKEQI